MLHFLCLAFFVLGSELSAIAKGALGGLRRRVQF